MTDPNAEPRVRLNRDRVLRAAIVLADANGIESLSMRKLGVELGIEAMSLYNHVANKSDLLDGMIDSVFGEIDLPSGGTDWRTAMRRRAISARQVMSRHPWAIGLMVGINMLFGGTSMIAMAMHARASQPAPAAPTSQPRSAT